MEVEEGQSVRTLRRREWMSGTGEAGEAAGGPEGVLPQNRMLKQNEGSYFKQVLLATLAVGQSAAFMWFFSNIWRLGRHWIDEPNRLILIAESMLLVTTFAFGIYCLVKLFRTRKPL